MLEHGCWNGFPEEKMVIDRGADRLPWGGIQDRVQPLLCTNFPPQ